MWWILIVIGIIALIIVGFLIGDQPNRKEILNLTFDNQVFGELQDGVYQGEFVGEKDICATRWLKSPSKREKSQSLK